MDYGFFVETSQVNILELHRDFLSLPFQATCVKLAGITKIKTFVLTYTNQTKTNPKCSLAPGLQAFCSHPSVLSLLNKLVGKILLMETLEPREQNKASVVVLYDTSQEDDININSTCVKALQDRNMNNPLIVSGDATNSTFAVWSVLNCNMAQEWQILKLVQLILGKINLSECVCHKCGFRWNYLLPAAFSRKSKTLQTPGGN